MPDYVIVFADHAQNGFYKADGEIHSVSIGGPMYSLCHLVPESKDDV